jgi:hypothetical protein
VPAGVTRSGRLTRLGTAKPYAAYPRKRVPGNRRAARIANSPGASSRGGKKSGSGGTASQGGTTAQKKAAGRKGGKAAARKS